MSVSNEPRLSTARNPELRDRVRSLQLPQNSRNAGGRGRGFTILVGLLVLLLLGSNIATFLYYKDRTATASAEPADPSATEAGAAKPSTTTTAARSSTSPKSSATPTSTAAAANAIALESKGYLVAAHQILVSPRVSGMVMRLNIVEGKRVEKGEVLAEIEDTEYRADRDRAAALLLSAEASLKELENGSRKQEVQQARADVDENEAQLAEAKRVLRREEQLIASQAGSEQSLTQARAQVQQFTQRDQRLRASLSMLEEGPRVERILAAKAQVEQARADLARSQWRLDNCMIRAPITGTILKKNAEENNLVNPVAFAGSLSLCDMADLSDLEVDLTILERDVSQVFVGQECIVRSEAYPDRPYKGRVDRLQPIADRAKGAIPVRVKVIVPEEEQGVYLKPEMGAIVTFYRDKAPETVAKQTN
jgi:HlyD family secretion protein